LESVSTQILEAAVPHSESELALDREGRHPILPAP
jgi:hypothetical protein